jgi:hypothetical protein
MQMSYVQLCSIMTIIDINNGTLLLIGMLNGGWHVCTAVL